MRATVIIGLALLGLMTSTLPPVAQADTGPMPARGLSFVWPDGTTGTIWQQAPTETWIGPTEVDFATYERRVLELVNQERWNNGQLPPLKGNQELTNAARYHAGDMRDDNYFDHDSYNRVNGNLVYERSWSQRIQSYYSGSGWLGENIAAGYTTPEAVMNGWMGSSGHRANILNTNYREIGIGYATGGTWGHYWVQDFGNRSNVYPLIINRDAYSSTTRAIDLYVYGSGWASQMRFRNDDGSWSAWESYNPDKTWTLSAGNGSRTVYTEIKNTSDTVLSASDDIILDEPVPVLAVDPTALVFLSEQASGQAIPVSQTVSVSNAGGSTLTWDFSSSGAWLQVSRTGDSLTVQPSGFGGYSVGHYSGHITVTATSALDSPQVIPMTGNSLCTTPCSIGVEVRLTVAETIHAAYLPLLLK